MNYKTAKLQDYFLWDGQITQVAYINPGKKSIGFKVSKTINCPHCDKPHEVDDWHDVIESSPMFQEGAIPVSSLNTETP